MSATTITIAQAIGRKLTKTMRSGGVVRGCDETKHFDFHHHDFGDLWGLNSLVADLLSRPDCAVVRGGILDPSRTRRVRRLLHRDTKTGDAPTLTDAHRAYVKLDADGIPAPDGINLHDLVACGNAARAMMPPAFHSVACIVQATAGHTFKPGLRLRLSFMLSRPMTGADCQRWLRDVPGIDPSTLRAAQLTYVAAPIFIGMRDPLATRLVMLDGSPAVQCPSQSDLLPPPREALDLQRLVGDASRSRYASAALVRACSAIATAPIDSRHPTAVAQAWGLARLVCAGLLTEQEVIRAVDGALEQAGKPRGEGAAIAVWAVSRRTDAGNLSTRGGG